MWMIKLPTKWNPVWCIISHNNLNTKNLSKNWILGNAAAESSALLPVNLLESVFQSDYYEHRGTQRIWYEARQNIQKIKCWTSPRCSCSISSGFEFFTSGLKSFFCFHLVSKALRQTVNMWGIGQRTWPSWSTYPNKSLTVGLELMEGELSLLKMLFKELKKKKTWTCHSSAWCGQMGRLIELLFMFVHHFCFQINSVREVFQNTNLFFKALNIWMNKISKL